jgi:hypothetical protein
VLAVGDDGFNFTCLRPLTDPRIDLPEFEPLRVARLLCPAIGHGAVSCSQRVLEPWDVTTAPGFLSAVIRNTLAGIVDRLARGLTLDKTQARAWHSSTFIVVLGTGMSERPDNVDHWVEK